MARTGFERFAFELVKTHALYAEIRNKAVSLGIKLTNEAIWEVVDQRGYLVIIAECDRYDESIGKPAAQMRTAD